MCTNFFRLNKTNLTEKLLVYPGQPALSLLAALSALLLVLGLCLPTAKASGQSSLASKFDIVESPSLYHRAINTARAEIEMLMAAGAPGVSVAVGVDGELVWAEGFGFANVEHQVPVNTETRFRIGSISKTMTSIAMAQLYERGVINLDEPIQTYLPTFPIKEKGIVTLRLLASHRAGIRHYLPDGSDNLITRHYDNVVDGLEIFSNDPLIAAPGEQYYYSSYGYNLLSAVLQKASGVKFLTLMRESVWSPLQLIETVADHTDYIIMNRAAPYYRRGDQLINAPAVDNSYKLAGGGFLSTPSDLVSFGFGVFNSGIIKNETLTLLLSPPQLPDGEIADQNYGLGWVDFYEDGSWFGHTGGSVGGTALFMVNPEAGVVMGLVCNLTGCFDGHQGLRQIGEYFVQ
ncbi:MAG: serine hydrolase [Gammaproteobacteria bacterium]|nr:serine hydrolase [Gammaproteobacteria bacterium]